MIPQRTLVRGNGGVFNSARHLNARNDLTKVIQNRPDFPETNVAVAEPRCCFRSHRYQHSQEQCYSCNKQYSESRSRPE